MKITVTVDVTVERTNGTISRFGETTITKAGDNPRLETDEVTKALDSSIRRITRPTVSPSA